GSDCTVGSLGGWPPHRGVGHHGLVRYQSTDTRRGARAAWATLRGGGTRHGSRAVAGRVPACATERRGATDRLGGTRYRQRDAPGGGAVVPGGRCPAADAELGEHDRGWTRPARERTVVDPLSGRCHRTGGDGVELGGRRVA